MNRAKQQSGHSHDRGRTVGKRHQDGPVRDSTPKNGARQALRRKEAPQHAEIRDSTLAQPDKVFGKHSVKAVLLKRPKAISRLFIAGQESYYDDIIRQCEAHGIPVEHLPWPEFLKLGEFTETDKHQGVLALVTPLRIFGDENLDRLRDAARILLLDQVSNPQNLATILRSASFFHADAVMLLRNRSADVTPTVVRFAVGGAEFIDIYKITNLARTIDALKDMGFWVYGLDERGPRTLAQVEFPLKTALVVGAENEGLRQKTRKYCDELCRIPGGREGVESLNAAVAATIALYELRRTRD